MTRTGSGRSSTPCAASGCGSRSTTSAPQYELVKGIIGLAHALRLAVVAEGIETAADRDLLVDARREYGQGYLFARPISAGEAGGRVRTAALPGVQ